MKSLNKDMGCLDSNLNQFIDSINKIRKIIESENIRVAIPSHNKPINRKRQHISYVGEIPQ
jgi:hypothetical protein